jgi:hypothetical protein
MQEEEGIHGRRKAYTGGGRHTREEEGIHRRRKSKQSE